LAGLPGMCPTLVAKANFVIQLNLSKVYFGENYFLVYLTDFEDLVELGPILNYYSLKMLGSNLLKPVFAFLHEFKGLSRGLFLSLLSEWILRKSRRSVLGSLINISFNGGTAMFVSIGDGKNSDFEITCFFFGVGAYCKSTLLGLNTATLGSFYFYMIGIIPTLFLLYFSILILTPFFFSFYTCLSNMFLRLSECSFFTNYRSRSSLY
jgi:hypothetical protein